MANEKVPCVDCDGKDIVLGDIVTMTFKVTGVHPDADTNEPGKAACNLALATTGDHFISVRAELVKKV